MYIDVSNNLVNRFYNLSYFDFSNQVLDPSSDTNPLLDNFDENSESSSDEGDSGEEGDEEDQLESSDDGMTDIEEDVGEEDKVNDKLRRAVLDALGDAGALTDVVCVFNHSSFIIR